MYSTIAPEKLSRENVIQVQLVYYQIPPTNVSRMQSRGSKYFLEGSCSSYCGLVSNFSVQ